MKPHSKLFKNNMMGRHLLLELSVHSKSVVWPHVILDGFVLHPITSLDLSFLVCAMEGKRFRVASTSALQPWSSAKLHSAPMHIYGWSTASSIALFYDKWFIAPTFPSFFCMYVCLCVCRCMYVHMCLEGRGQPCVCFSGIVHFFKNSISLTGLGLTK